MEVYSAGKPYRCEVVNLAARCAWALRCAIRVLGVGPRFCGELRVRAIVRRGAVCVNEWKSLGGLPRQYPASSAA